MNNNLDQEITNQLSETICDLDPYHGSKLVDIIRDSMRAEYVNKYLRFIRDDLLSGSDFSSCTDIDDILAKHYHYLHNSRN